MGYVLSKVIGTLLAPGIVLVIGLTVATALLWTRRFGPRARTLLSALVVGFWVLLVLPIQPWMTETLEDRFPANPPLPERVDGIIVLGGAIDPYISRSRQRITVNAAAERLIAGVQLARAHPEAKLLYTGGSADPLRPDATEAPLARDLLIGLGVAPDRLLIEEKSRNTYENALFSQPMAAPQAGQTWVLVTSARHMARSVGIFQRLNWPVIAYPVDFTSGGMEWTNVDLPIKRLRLFAEALHEWIGLAYYHSRGWTDRLFPGPGR